MHDQAIDENGIMVARVRRECSAGAEAHVRRGDVSVTAAAPTLSRPWLRMVGVAACGVGLRGSAVPSGV